MISNTYVPQHLRDNKPLTMSRAFEFAVDGSYSPVCYATIFADSQQEGHKILWSILDEAQQNRAASVEMTWNYATDGKHVFCRPGAVIGQPLLEIL